MNKPPSSLSLDLDNLWSYLKVRGDSSWQELPSFLDMVIPRVLRFLDDRKCNVTVFLVGLDAAQSQNKAVLQAIAEAGHEIGNHSLHHEPWFHLYSDAELETEVGVAEEWIEEATGRRPVGFRGPGFSMSSAGLHILQKRGYRYDATALPTFVGPVARAYYFHHARLSADERQQRKRLFGGIGDCLIPLSPFRWQLSNGLLTEIPITTMPIFQIPIHFSYILYMSTFSRRLAQMYFRAAVKLCHLSGIQPSLLLHPLDFLGSDDLGILSFFPGMRLRSSAKIRVIHSCLDELTNCFSIHPVLEHVELLDELAVLPRIHGGFVEPGLLRQAFGGLSRFNPSNLGVASRRI